MLYNTWVYDATDTRVINTDNTMFEGSANGVIIKQAGIYKFNCTMMYSMYYIANPGTERLAGGPGDGGQSVKIATRFVKNNLYDDYDDHVYDTNYPGFRKGMNENNPGPVCVSPVMRWWPYETERAASASWSCIINCEENDVITVYFTRAGYAIDNCVTPQNACNLLVEYIG